MKEQFSKNLSDNLSFDLLVSLLENYRKIGYFFIILENNEVTKKPAIAEGCRCGQKYRNFWLEALRERGKIAN